MTTMTTESTHEYDTVDLLDMHADEGFFSYPCPCGDVFAISHEELVDFDDVAHCASCSLVLKVSDKTGLVDTLRSEDK